jgi:hypothetical protein
MLHHPKPARRTGRRVLTASFITDMEVVEP